MKATSKYLSLLLVAFCVVGPVAAAPPKSAELRADLGELVVPGARTDYLGLARRFVSDLHWDGNHYSGRDYRPVRHAAGPNNDKSYLDPAAIATVSRLDFVEGGRRRMVLLFDFAERAETTQGLGVLALYDLSGEVGFLDAVDVGLDRWTFFRDPPALVLSNGEPVLLVDSTHSNASESYMFTSLVLARKGQLLPVTTYFTLGAQSCAGRIDQDSSFRAAKGKARGIPDTIEITVNVTARRSGRDCNGEKLFMASRKLVVRYAWDSKSGQYQPSSDALQRLEDENMKDP